jgi:hypothetical protein
MNDLTMSKPIMTPSTIAKTTLEWLRSDEAAKDCGPFNNNLMLERCIEALQVIATMRPKPPKCHGCGKVLKLIACACCGSEMEWKKVKR